MVETQSPRRNPVIVLLGFLTACYGVGYVGSYATLSSIAGWYVVLAKPSWTPPAWLFAPVWTVLYGMMGVAAWLVWKTPPGILPSGRRGGALVMFFIQLLLNGLWSWLFFWWHQLWIAAYEIGLLWLAILATALLFSRIHRLASLLMVPYLGWVAFAGALNVAIARLNP